MIDLGWSPTSTLPTGFCDKSLVKVHFSKRGVCWNAQRRHLNKLFLVVTLYFDNLISVVGLSSIEFNLYMRLFIAIEAIVEKALVLFCKDDEEAGICTGWDLMPKLDGFSDSFTVMDYGQTIAHMAITEGLPCLGDDYEEQFVVEDEYELVNEGELYKLYMLKYLIMNFRYMKPNCMTLEVNQRLSAVFNAIITNDEQIVAVNLYVRHIESLLLPCHYLRSRSVIFEVTY